MHLRIVHVNYKEGKLFCSAELLLKRLNLCSIAFFDSLPWPLLSLLLSSSFDASVSSDLSLSWSQSRALSSVRPRSLLSLSRSL